MDKKVMHFNAHHKMKKLESLLTLILLGKIQLKLVDTLIGANIPLKSQISSYNLNQLLKVVLNYKFIHGVPEKLSLDGLTHKATSFIISIQIKIHLTL